MSVDSIIREVASEKLDISWIIQEASTAIQEVQYAMQRPSVLYRPRISIDGNQWCVLYGDNLQDGIAGFGNTPALAMADFDKAREDALK